MSDAEPNPGGEEKEEEDKVNQYDQILRAMEEGLLITINEQAYDATPLGECRVRWSYDDKTRVVCRYGPEEDYQIFRDDRGRLVFAEITEDGLSHYHEVETIEVIGLD